jgi:hypothetical protein
MGHFAKINQKRIVTQVIVGDEDYVDTLPGTWIQTSYTGEFRKNYAGVGYTYDYFKDAFISPQPYNSWVLNENTCRWEAPVAYPSDNKLYDWDEENLKWVIYT